MQENKNHASPLLQAVAIQHTHSSYSKSATGGSTRRRLAPEKNKTFARHCIRFVFSEKPYNSQVSLKPHHPYQLTVLKKYKKANWLILSKYTKTSQQSYRTGCQSWQGFASPASKNLPFSFAKDKAKQKEYFLVCPCIYGPQPVTTWALCFGASYVVNWVAGGCSFTFISIPGFAYISCVIPVGSTLSSRGCRSLLVGSHFRGLTFIFLCSWNKQTKSALQKSKRKAS